MVSSALVRSKGSRVCPMSERRHVHRNALLRVVTQTSQTFAMFILKLRMFGWEIFFKWEVDQEKVSNAYVIWKHLRAHLANL